MEETRRFKSSTATQGGAEGEGEDEGATDADEGYTGTVDVQSYNCFAADFIDFDSIIHLHGGQSWNYKFYYIIYHQYIFLHYTYFITGK